MEIDTAQAACFLTALTGDADHTFQTFSESGRGENTLSRVLHGNLARHAVTLESLNLKGAGVFVMVNRGDCYGRKSDNVTGARALFVDLDGAPVEPVLSGPIAPRIVVESSPGKWHCYWPIVDLPLDRFTDAQKALAARFDGDAKVHDRARVMRLPGFLHNKAAPFQTRLVSCEEAPLTWREMVEAFDLRDRMRLPDTIPDGERNDTLYKLALSAARKGVPEAEQLAKAQTVNARRCRPPLEPAEVAQIVASAYARPAQGFARIPLAVLDSDAYRALGDGARTMLLLAYRKADAYTSVFPLVWSELRPWFPREKTFKRYRQELAASSLLSVAIPPEPCKPRLGRGPIPTFYRMAIGDKSAPYSIAPIGVKSAPPEALQALGSQGSQGSQCPAGADGHPETKRRAA